MTKREVLEQFKSDILPAIVDRYGKNDKPALCEAWNNYTDGLCKDGLITAQQYDTWANPF